MRLLVKLDPYKSDFLAINYYYSFSAAIYKLLQFGSPDFAKFLHDIGFRLNGKTYKLFAFALQFSKLPLIHNNYFSLKNQSISLIISSPLVDEFIKNFVIGSFKESSIEIMADGIFSEFRLESIEALPEPDFGNNCYFRMLSPLVLSTHSEDYDNSTNQFLRHNESIELINRVFNRNLKNKYCLIYGEDYTGEDLSFKWDDTYIEQKLAAGKRLTRKVSFLWNMTRPVEIIGNMIPFYLEGDPKLIKVGYQAGYGERNSQGFGLTAIDN